MPDRSDSEQAPSFLCDDLKGVTTSAPIAVLQALVNEEPFPLMVLKVRSELSSGLV